MCGIAGIHITLRAVGETAADEALRRMTGRLAHRGPDDRGTAWARGRDCAVGFGHTRLSIIDLSSAGHQPMHDPATGNRITYNGETYNFGDVRRELSAEENSWRSQTDTETILRAYARWGTDCVTHLRGMFAFAIWDAEKQQLFIARDRLGIKPLYYFQAGGAFLFASEVRALLASGLVPRELDPSALSEYLTYQSVPAPKTLVKDVGALPPGCWLTVDAEGRVTQKRYWHLLEQSSAEARTATYDEARRRVRELLHEATALHLVSDVPVGVFLSGGIDSSAIVALMREQGQTASTFSVVFSEQAYSEAAHARRVADMFRAEHTELHLTEDTLLDELPAALAAMDQPTGDGVNSYVVARAVRETGIKVALSGLGGDEFFAGYDSFTRLERATRLLRPWGRVPVAVRRLAARTLQSIGGSSVRAVKASAMIGSDGTMAALYPIMRQVLSTGQRQALLKDSWQSAVREEDDPYVRLLRETLAGDPSAEPLAQVSYAEGRTYMHDVLLRDADAMSMAHALEVRVPLLDHKLVEYLIGLPDAHKRANGTPKRLLVESLDGLLPDEIVRRPKQGFTLPFAVWMRGALRTFCEERLGPERLGSRGIFDVAQVRKLWGDFQEGRAHVSWSRLWVLVALEEWLERNEMVG